MTQYNRLLDLELALGHKSIIIVYKAKVDVEWMRVMQDKLDQTALHRQLQDLINRRKETG